MSVVGVWSGFGRSNTGKWSLFFIILNLLQEVAFITFITGVKLILVNRPKFNTDPERALNTPLNPDKYIKLFGIKISALESVKIKLKNKEITAIYTIESFNIRRSYGATRVFLRRVGYVKTIFSSIAYKFRLQK